MLQMPSRLFKSSRGSVLLHVLVTSILVTVIAAGLMTFLMLQYKMADLSAKTTQNKLKGDQAFSELLTNWNVAGVAPCTDFGPFTCADGAGTVCATACKAPENCASWTYDCNCRAGSTGPTICVTDPINGIRKLNIVSASQ